MSYIFISYSREDETYAHQLAEYLQQHGFDIWIDNVNLEAGTNWFDAIAEGITNCGAFVVIMTPASKISKWVYRETMLAENKNKPVFPLLLAGENWDIFVATHYIDVRSGKLPQDSLITSLNRYVKPKSVAGNNQSPQLSSIDLMPQPFEWVQIPAGKVTLEDASGYGGTKGGTYTVPAFQIAKYPVTVAQYSQFVQDNGYATENYWTPEGWAWKTQENITLPRLWEDARFHKPDHPIVGVSWYESIAFCHWLSAKTDEKITLPTEQQWQRAAQGDEGREYPWGKDWDGSRCNHNVYENYQEHWETSSTSPVTQYPSGTSPYGVYDMAGNVWEWVLTQWGKDDISISGDNTRGIRGGSWGNGNSEDFCCAYRGGNFPNDQYSLIGFRLARS